VLAYEMVDQPSVHSRDRHFHFAWHLYQPWGPPNLISSGYKGVSPAVNPKHGAVLHLMLIFRRTLYLIPACVCIALCWNIWIVFTCTELFRLFGV